MCVVYDMTCFKFALKDFRKKGRQAGRKKGREWGQWSKTGKIWTDSCGSVMGAGGFITQFSLLFLHVGNEHNEKLGNILASQSSS